jgi:hypothetical protein
MVISEENKKKDKLNLNSVEIDNDILVEGDCDD